MGLLLMCDKQLPIFCVFCPQRFAICDKQTAAHHYWSHIAPASWSSGTFDQPALTKQHVAEWITDFINNCTAPKRSNELNNFADCPVCEKIDTKDKVTRKPIVLREHLRSHLLYRQYLCKICSETDCFAVGPRKVLQILVKGSRGELSTTHNINFDIKTAFMSHKSSLKALTKHIKDDHLTDAVRMVPGIGIMAFEDLIAHTQIFALDQLIENATGLPRKAKESKQPQVTTIVTINQEQFTIRSEPRSDTFLGPDANSLLAPRFNFNEHCSLIQGNKNRRSSSTSNRKSRKKKSCTTVFDVDLDTRIVRKRGRTYSKCEVMLDELFDGKDDCDLTEDVDSMLSSSISDTSVSYSHDFHNNAMVKAIVSEHSYCQPYNASPEARYFLDNGYDSEVLDEEDNLSDVIDGSFELLDEKPYLLCDSTAFAEHEKDITRSCADTKYLPELLWEVVEKYFQATF